MFSAIQKHPVRWFFIAWTLLNLIQAYSTQLLDDEAYYWVYSRYLDWGYFDHPPMVALLIKAGYALFANEFGVRFFMIILNTATLWIIYTLLPVRNNKLFMALASSVAVLQIGGILAVPDIPLTFFTALFFRQYRRFLENTDLKQSLLLGLVIACMLYSKYHGILIIFFTFLSNPRLALRWPAWVAVVSGLILFAPHLYWQYDHGFPSLWYHLKERNAPTYQFNFTAEYIGGQLLIAGPLIGWLLFYAVVRQKPSDAFSRALTYSCAGFFIFFLISTIKGRVEANWTVPALVPLLILSHTWLSTNATAATWIYRLCIPALVMVMLIRLYMAFDLPALNERFKDEMHNNISWAKAIQQKAGGLPVVFTNSYQYPSKYWFYSGDTAFGLNTTYYRRNNYNFWPLEKQLQHRTVFLVETVRRDSASTPILTAKGLFNGTVLPGYRSYSDIELRPERLPLEIRRGESVQFPVTAKGTLEGKTIWLDLYKKDDLVQRSELLLTSLSSRQVYSGTITVNLEPGIYKARIGLQTSIRGLASQNSPSFSLTVLP